MLCSDSSKQQLPFATLVWALPHTGAPEIPQTCTQHTCRAPALTLSPGDSVLVSADSQPPVPVPGNMMVVASRVPKISFRSCSVGSGTAVVVGGVGGLCARAACLWEGAAKQALEAVEAWRPPSSSAAAAAAAASRAHLQALLVEGGEPGVAVVLPRHLHRPLHILMDVHGPRHVQMVAPRGRVAEGGPSGGRSGVGLRGRGVQGVAVREVGSWAGRGGGGGAVCRSAPRQGCQA